MPPSKPRPTWPSDDQVRELQGDEELAEDGRKLQDSERVGAMSPDADPEPTRPTKPPPRKPR